MRVVGFTEWRFVLGNLARPLLSTSSLSRKRSWVRIPSGLPTRVAIGFYAVLVPVRTLLCCEGRAGLVLDRVADSGT